MQSTPKMLWASAASQEGSGELRCKAFYGASGVGVGKDLGKAGMVTEARAFTKRKPAEDVPEFSPGDGILWLVAALAQVCQEYAADCSAKIESEVPARGDSRKADRIASKLVQQPQPMPLNVIKIC
ncbi:unnamed protein product [Symbiodinium sp. KB8]|nr:unnamed protein product [Symbiodinium sp. KB8]